MSRKIAFLVLILLLLGCRKGSDTRNYEEVGKPTHGDTLITSSIGEASNLIPILAGDSASHEIAGYIYNGLVKYDKNLNIVGDLAESWDVSPDKLTITFRLRKNVRWHDGAPFTVRDVIYTYNVIVDPATPTPYSGDFLTIKKAEAIDDHTFQVTYSEPFAPALVSWTVSILPSHLLDGKDIISSPLSRRPVGTGPYRFQEWVAGDRIVLIANDDYYEGRPYLARRIVRVIPDPATMFLEVKNSGVDMAGLTPLQYVKQTDYAKFNRHFNKFQYLSFTYVYLGFNLKHPLFRDKRVRQAITYAIDKQEIVDGILLGQGVVAEGPYKPDTWAFNPNIKKHPFDREKARLLLEQAGFVKGPNGKLSRDGKPFEFTILCNQGNDVRIHCAELIQQRLAVLGITVKIRVIEWASFVNQYIDKRNYEAVILGWTIPQDPDIFDIWHSSKQKPKELNFMGFENREVDELLVRARRTSDKEERKRYYWKIQEILAEEQPYTFLFIPYALLAVHKRIKGIEPAAAGISYNFKEWYVPEGQQRYRSSDNARLHP